MKYSYKYDNKYLIEGDLDLENECLNLYNENKFILCIDLDYFEDNFNNDFKELIDYLFDDNFANYYELLANIYKNTEVL